MVENLGRANFGAPHNFEQLKGLWEGEVVLDGEIRGLCKSASKSSIRRFVITEKAPTRAFSWFESGYYRFHI